VTVFSARGIWNCYSHNLFKGKPSQAKVLTGGWRIARSTSRHPPVC